MKKKILIIIVFILLAILIVLGILSYSNFEGKKRNKKIYKIQEFTEEKCDDKYCISDLSVKYIDKDRSYYQLKGLIYYKSEDIIDNYCIKISLISKKESEVLMKCYDAGYSNFFSNIDEVIVSDKYVKFDDVKIEKMSDEEIKSSYIED